MLLHYIWLTDVLGRKMLRAVLCITFAKLVSCNSVTWLLSAYQWWLPVWWSRWWPLWTESWRPFRPAPEPSCETTLPLRCMISPEQKQTTTFINFIMQQHSTNHTTHQLNSNTLLWFTCRKILLKSE